MGTVVRICYHCEILRHVDTTDEDWFDIISMSLVASESHPGIIIAFRVFCKSGFEFDVFPINGVLCD